MKPQLTDDLSGNCLVSILEHKLQNDRVLKTDISGIEVNERRATASRFEDMMNKFRTDINN